MSSCFFSLREPTRHNFDGRTLTFLNPQPSTLYTRVTRLLLTQTHTTHNFSPHVDYEPSTTSAHTATPHTVSTTPSQNSTKLIFLISAHAKFFPLVSRSLNPLRFVPMPSEHSLVCMSLCASVHFAHTPTSCPTYPPCDIPRHSQHCVRVFVRRIAKYGKLAAKFVTDSNVNAQAKGVAAGELTRTRTRTRTPRLASPRIALSCRVLS